jgi:hypothetical protein
MARSAKETAQIREICALGGVDPEHMLENPNYDLLEVFSTLKMIRAVREAMRPPQC